MVIALNKKLSRAEIKAAQKKQRERFAAGRKAEQSFQRQIVKVARMVGTIVDAYAPDGVISDLFALEAQLTAYAKALEPWANLVTSHMIADVNRRDAKAWQSYSKEMGLALRQEIAEAPVGAAFQKLQAESAALIKSIPTEAAARIRKLAEESLYSSARASTIQKQILESGDVAVSRAKLIARTQVSTATTNLTRARAEQIGSVAYIWRTSRDGNVRDSHKRMEGKVIYWSAPPTLDGLTGHAGALPNCRCTPEPIFPDEM